MPFLRSTQKKTPTFSVEILFKRGLKHEKDYLKEIKKNKKKVVIIDSKPESSLKFD